MATKDLDLNALARLGAQARLAELVEEMGALLRQFPGLAKPNAKASGGGDGPGPLGEERGPKKRRKRSRMSKAARNAASVRMKKYWAEKRATK